MNSSTFNSDMFIRSFFAATITTLIVAYLIPQSEYMRWRLFDAEYGMWKAKTKLVEDATSKYTNVVLGDSRILAGYNPSLNDSESTVNLALGGGTPIEAFFILNRLISSNSNVSRILISFSPTHLENADMFLHRTIVFKFLKNHEVDDVLENEKNENLFKIDKNEYIYCKFELPMCYKPYYKYLLRLGTIEKNKEMYRDTYGSKGWHLFGVNSPNAMPGEVARRRFTPDPIIDKYFTRLISLARSRNIEIYFYATPLAIKAYTAISKTYRSDFFDYIRSKSSDILVIDGGVVPITYIGDGSHVNHQGSVFTTKYINTNIFGLN